MNPELNLALTTILNKTTDHNAFLRHLACWLNTHARHFDDLNGSYNDVHGAADCLDLAAGESDDEGVRRDVGHHLGAGGFALDEDEVAEHFLIEPDNDDN